MGSAGVVTRLFPLDRYGDQSEPLQTLHAGTYVVRRSRTMLVEEEGLSVSLDRHSVVSTSFKLESPVGTQAFLKN